MQLKSLRDLLTNNEWREENLTHLPDYSLYKNIEALFTFQNRLALQYHPKGGNIILTVSPSRNSVCRTMAGDITATVDNNSIGIKVDYKNNLEDIILKLIEQQDEVTVDMGYISLSQLFNPLADSSILALEQFLNKEIYLKQSSEEPRFPEKESSLIEQSNGFCQQKLFNKSHDLLMDCIVKQGIQNVYLFNNLLYSSTVPNLPGITLTPENVKDIIKALLSFLGTIKHIDEDRSAYVFFISRTTYLMIGIKQFRESIDAIRKYAMLGGEINADVLLNYSYCASELTDTVLKTEVLKEMIQFYEKDSQLLSHGNKSFLYMADNIATLAASVGDKENTLSYLKIARDLDPEFSKNKTSEYYAPYHNDPDFLALFDQSPSQQDDVIVFPGQPVAKLSDYVKIVKGMQSGNMGVLSEYGLDIMQYASVAQAWASKLSDPTISAKFGILMLK